MSPTSRFRAGFHNLNRKGLSGHRSINPLEISVLFILTIPYPYCGKAQEVLTKSARPYCGKAQDLLTKSATIIIQLILKIILQVVVAARAKINLTSKRKKKKKPPQFRRAPPRFPRLLHVPSQRRNRFPPLPHLQNRSGTTPRPALLPRRYTSTHPKQWMLMRTTTAAAAAIGVRNTHPAQNLTGSPSPLK